jgi:hypothetical protein
VGEGDQEFGDQTGLMAGPLGRLAIYRA